MSVCSITMPEFRRMSPPPAFLHLESVVLRVRNRTAAVQWYRERLGFQILFEDPTQGVAVFNVGPGCTLTLWELQSDEIATPPSTAGTFPVFETTDAPTQRHRLRARGVSTSGIRQSPGLRSFAFWDLDGNRLDAWELLEP